MYLMLAHFPNEGHGSAFGIHLQEKKRWNFIVLLLLLSSSSHSGKKTSVSPSWFYDISQSVQLLLWICFALQSSAGGLFTTVAEQNDPSYYS